VSFKTLVCANIYKNENGVVSRHIMQDGLVVGVILFLLIAALGVYVWLRFQQIETRLSIAESISLDMKMILQQYSQFPSVPETTVEEVKASIPAPVAAATYKYPASGASIHVTKVDSSDPEMVVETLTELMDAEPLGSDSMFPSVVDEVKKEMQSDAGDGGFNIGGNDSSADADITIHKNDYDKMIMKDLRALAKNRGISGTGSMNRQQIVAALREKDTEVVEYEPFNAEEVLSSSE
jgi:hypothetical protein